MKQLLRKLGIHDRESFIKLIAQFSRFAIVGLMNTIIMQGIYYGVILINLEWYLLGQVLGFIVSVASSFYWGRRFVFKGSQEGILIPLLKTYIAYGSTFFLSVVLLYLEVEKFGMSKFVAPMLNLLVTIPLNFLVNKFWTFKQGRQEAKNDAVKL